MGCNNVSVTGGLRNATFYEARRTKRDRRIEKEEARFSVTHKTARADGKLFLAAERHASSRFLLVLTLVFQAQALL